MAHESKLARRDFPIPVSFIYGGKDWIGIVDKFSGKEVVAASQFEESMCHIIPNGDH